MADHKSIAVVGAGLVGPLQALFLAKAGFTVHMYEKRSDFRGTSEFAFFKVGMHSNQIRVQQTIKDKVHTNEVQL